MKLLLDLLEDGEKLILEYGGRVSLQAFGSVAVVGLEAVEELLLERSLRRHLPDGHDMAGIIKK